MNSQFLTVYNSKAIALLYNRLVDLKNCSEVHQWGALETVVEPNWHSVWHSLGLTWSG